MPDTAPPRRQRWFVDVDSKTYGPYDESTIAQMVEGGQIMRNDLVVREGASDWVEGAKEPALGRLFRSKSAEPPIRRKRRWTSKLVLAGCFAITLVWIAWPYYAVFSLIQAVKDGDASTLERRVDWNGVRQALRGDLNAQLLQKLRKKGESNDAMATGLATLLGPAVINQMIDSYVTPQAIATLRRSDVAAKAKDEPPAIDKSASLLHQANWNHVRYAFFSGSPLAFRIDILPPNDPPLQNPVRLDFSWNGDWKLSRITLPDEIFTAPEKPSMKWTRGAGPLEPVC
jgi:hypothetical protein